jgi:hypothetical protein
MMHWPSVPDALTAEPSTRPPPPSLVAVPFGSTRGGGKTCIILREVPVPHVSGCCAVWKHQRREGRGKRFHLPVCSRLRQNKEKKDRNSLVDTPGAHHCVYDRPSRISTVPSPQKHLRTSSQANRPDFASDSHLLDIHSSPFSPELDRQSP